MKSPVFVVGYMHSGTTLLLNILRQHSTIFSVGGETKFFDFLPAIRDRFGNLQNDRYLRECIEFTADVIHNGYRLRRTAEALDEPFILSTQDIESVLEKARAYDCRTPGLIFRLIFDRLTKRAGKQRWLEKTPTHIYHIPAILRDIPDARFVEIVRDPRDVLASKKTGRATVWTDRYRPEDRPRKHLEKAYDPFWDTLAWKSAVRSGATVAGFAPKCILRIRYEDLVTEPRGTIRAVCDFLTLPFEDAMLNVKFRNAAAWKDAPSRGIFADSVGRWTQVLTPCEVALCQFLVRRELASLGYATADVNRAKTVLRAAGLVIRSGFEFFQRLFRKLRLGGINYIATVLGNYWKRLKIMMFE